MIRRDRLLLRLKSFTGGFWCVECYRHRIGRIKLIKCVSRSINRFVNRFPERFNLIQGGREDAVVGNAGFGTSAGASCVGEGGGAIAPTVNNPNPNLRTREIAGVV